MTSTNLEARGADAAPSSDGGHWRRRLLGVALLAGLAVLSFAAFRIARTFPESPQFLSLGYAGVFLLTLSCSATLFLPVPAWGAVAIAGSFLNPFLLGLAAGAGAATGEFTGYIAGRSGSMALGHHDHPWFGRVHRLIDGHGFLALFLLSAIPNPLFDIAGIIAGSQGFSPVRYWLAVALGKSLVYTLLALGGQAVMPILGV